jgi:tRNA threonylcarbamoyladenosine biosynthesis protein TsaB
MILIALDTSTRQAGAALLDTERGLIAEHNWHSANRHTRELMPQVKAMVDRAGLSAKDLGGVAVAIGPGSFTGIRVALSAAKGLAIARSIPIVGVPTLDATAYPHQAQPAPVFALIQAGRGRVCWAPYAHGPGGWGPQEPYRLSTLEELAQAVFRPVVFVGELSPDYRTVLERWAGASRALFLPPALAERRAGYVAALGAERLVRTGGDDPALLSPIYLHEPAPPGRVG